MRARTLNARIPHPDDLGHLEEKLARAFRTVLAAAARRAGDRFEHFAGHALAASGYRVRSVTEEDLEPHGMICPSCEREFEVGDEYVCQEVAKDVCEVVCAGCADASLVAAPGVTARSAMVAVYPAPDQQALLARQGGEDADIIHCTLAFLGEIEPDQADAVVAALAPIVEGYASLAGEVGGVAVFSDNGDGHPSLALPDVVGLAELRHAVCVALDEAGIFRATNHGWTPHMTLSYEETPATPPPQLIGLPVAFDSLSVSVGDVRRDLALRGGRADDTVPVGTASAAEGEVLEEADPTEFHRQMLEAEAEDALRAAGPPTWSQPHPDELVNVDELIRQFRTKADPTRLAAIEAAAGPALKAAGIDFDAANPMVDAVYARVGQHIAYVAETTRLNAMRIVRRAYEEGLSIPDTARAIREGMAAAGAVRATLIARTEMTSLTNGGSLAAARIIDAAISEARDAGEEDAQDFQGYHKRWLTAPGAHFPRHEDYDGLDGQTVPLDAYFDVEGVALLYPGDPDGPPEETCNCRCTLVYVDGAGEETDADEGGGMGASGQPVPFTVRGDEGGIVKRKKLTPEAALVADAAEELAPPTDDAEESGGMTAFVRIRPEIDPEFHSSIANSVTSAVRDGVAAAFGIPNGSSELAAPVVADVRPERSDEIAPPATDIATNAQQRWEAAFCPEGYMTDDGRVFAPNSIGWRETPLTLMAMTETPGEGGHAGAKLVGRIERIWRDEESVPTLIRAEGTFDDSEYGLEIARLVGDQTLRGNSVDLAIRRAEFGLREVYVDDAGLWRDDAPAEGEAPEPSIDELLDGDAAMIVRDARIGMSTVCPFPAFDNAGISLVAAGEGHPAFGIEDKGGMHWRIWLQDSVVPAGGVVTASAAGLAPVAPPVEWFEDPELEEPTPLTVDEDGRVYGHAWTWNECHIGFPGTCVVAPHSRTNYAYFHLKEVECDDGTVVDVGTVTLGTGHAGQRATPEEATEHYDNTGTAVADVRIYEDEFGGAVAGALRPDLAAGRVREFRGAVLSGDWRKRNGNLELLGLLAVNVPGFPVPRTRALVASAENGDPEILALVAAGIAERPAATELAWVEFDDVAVRAKLAALAARAAGGLEALAELAVGGGLVAAPSGTARTA